MHRSSESIAALAAALAKAQSELSNPEKSLIATISAGRPGEGATSFRYAPLSSGLDIVRKALGQHQIAIVQTTAIDVASGIINLTTVLAHASGEWISSDWPVCRVGDTASPHRMGAALTYARRYALFTLVGIAGEDDLDAPDLNDGGAPTAGAGNGILPDAPARHRPQGNGKAPRQPILDARSSAALRDRLVREIVGITSADEGFDWAYKALSKKNTLTAADARLVQLAFELRLSALEAPAEGREDGPQSALAGADEKHGVDPLGQLPPATDHPSSAAGSTEPDPGGARSGGIDKSVLSIPEARRYRDKAHLKFVASWPCLICGRRPADPHHLRFAQVTALGRKVSDEFTVPLCRLHHRELHRARNEPLWWKRFGLDPIKIATQLWERTRGYRPPETATPTPAQAYPLPSPGDMVPESGATDAGRAAPPGTRRRTGEQPEPAQPGAPGPSGP